MPKFDNDEAYSKEEHRTIQCSVKGRWVRLTNLRQKKEERTHKK